MLAGKEYQIALRLDQVEEWMCGKESLASDCHYGHDAKHCEQAVQMPLDIRKYPDILTHLYG